MLRWITLRIAYPIARLFGMMLRIDKTRIESYFIKLNNRMVAARMGRYAPAEIMLLMPHCMQNSECERKITGALDNCQRCGQCVVKDLIELSEKYNVPMRIVGGGGMARRMLLEERPSCVVAAACERELIAGIVETWPLPAFGIVNLRPEGYCKNTGVDMVAVEEATVQMLDRTHARRRSP